MPRKSATDNVTKICGCKSWKTCAHPWYLDFQRKNVRYRDNLDQLIERHAPDFTAAKDEARRAIVAKLEARDPKDLLPADDPTLAEILRDYDRAHPRKDRRATKEQGRTWQIGRINAIELVSPDGLRRFGDWRARLVTTDSLNTFRALRPLVGGNRDLAFLRAAFNWAVGRGLIPGSPFRVGHVAVVKLAREEPRSRRLYPGEAERLQKAAAGWLQDLIVAAVETACRQGELLGLQWHQVRFFPRAEVFLPAGQTKAKKDRRIPISSVLRAVLERRRHDPAGDLLPHDAYVFGDEIGRARQSVKTAWNGARRRAKADTLHFHDLRREGASRWMDAGVPLATIQRWLGHANIAQTSTYLGASLGNDAQDMAAFEQRVGRLTHIDVFGGSNGSERPRSDSPMIEKTQSNAVGF